MIALKRVRDTASIPEKYRGLQKAAADLELLRMCLTKVQNKIKKFQFNESYWSLAKPQLLKESWGKCAYCESTTSVVEYGDVEHYRPKSRYWWLAYTYDNYLYACQICNQKYKGDEFPVLGTTPFSSPAVMADMLDNQLLLMQKLISPDPIDQHTSYTYEAYLAAHQAERPALLNPYLDDPAIYFAYEADDTIKEVKIVPTRPEYQPYVDGADQLCGLNQRVDLKNLRYKTYQIFRALKYSYNLAQDPVMKAEIVNALSTMKADDYLFAGMIRYFDNQQL